MREDPSLRVRQDAKSGQTFLSGMAESQLEVTVEKLRARHGVNVIVGRPQVAYRETITKVAEVTQLHKKQSGGPAQFTRVTLRIVPLTRGEDVRFANESVGGTVPRDFVPAVEAGVRRTAGARMVVGFRWSTSRRRCSTARSTSAIRRHWRSNLRPSRPSARLRIAPLHRCWSR